MTLFTKILLLFLSFTGIFATCNKTPPIPTDDFYFRCKINGQTYIPNSCANCLNGTILGDTTFLLGANAGFEAILIGIIKLNHLPISITTYVLNNNLQQKALYKNSTLTNDKYETDSLHTGQLQIISLDKTNRIIQGTFYFKAYNSYRNDSVSVTEGYFRLKYTTN